MPPTVPLNAGCETIDPQALRRRLLRLVGRIARKDRGAFADLYAEVSEQLLDELRATMSDPRDAIAIRTATFVEAWALARFHTDPEVDVYAWLSGIAIRRAAERGYADDRSLDLAGSPTTTSRRQLWLTAVATSYDRQAHLALVALLNRPRSG